MAGVKKYTRQKLIKAIGAYFDSITYKKCVTYTDGEPVRNVNGEIIEIERYAVPPTVAGICMHLGIDRSTWASYCDEEKSPKLYDVCQKARDKMELYLEEQLITREKSVQGIIFNLQNNYGWKDKKEIELGRETRESMENVGLSEKMKIIQEATKMIGNNE